MKPLFRSILPLLSLLLLGSASLSAQQVNTLYFLENAPQRTTLNPAFVPVSKGYVNIPAVGFVNAWVGNNALSLSDLVFADPLQPTTAITILHPHADKAAFVNSLPQTTLLQADASILLLGMGARVKDKGYWHFDITQRIQASVGLPRSLFGFVLGGGMTDLEGVNTIDMSGLRLSATTYSDFGFGYSHTINERWTVGGKLHILLGELSIQADASDVELEASMDEWALESDVDMNVSGPFNYALIEQTGGILSTVRTYGPVGLFGTNDKNQLGSMVKPSGFGAAVDLGVEYRPFDFLSVNAAVTDLGFLHWGKTNSRKGIASMDTTFVGAGDINYSDYLVDGKFSADSLSSHVTSNVLGLLDAAHTSFRPSDGFSQFLNMKLNIGADFHFLKDKITVGVLSQTRVVNKKVQEELTIGLGLKPCNWFNFALSYSLIDNGKYSNFGAGLSLMPYDGIHILVAADYIPTFYTSGVSLPYHIKGLNASLGLSIVWGTNARKSRVTAESIVD